MEQVKKKRDKSLKASFIYSMMLTVFMIILLSVLTIWGCSTLQKVIMPDKNEAYLNITTTYFDGTETTSTVIVTFGKEEKVPSIFEANTLQPSVQNISKCSIDKIESTYDSLTPKKKAAYSALSVAMVGLPIIYSIVGVLLCAVWFYRKKLEKPIDILSKATDKIGNEDLDFTVSYDSADEMGKLCDSFEMMRQTLYKNNREVWNMLEERRMLQASVAHDLRNPISIIEGYTEYLQQNIPKGTLSEERLLHTIENLATAARRLERYTDSIQDIQRLEDLEIAPVENDLPGILSEIAEDFTHIAAQEGIRVEVCCKISKCQVGIDGQVLYRILENLFSNALRYTKEKIKIMFALEGSILSISLEDDGPGFPNEVLENQDRYTLSPGSGDRHMGMGLIMSRILCKKHGGRLKLSNSASGGAKVNLTICIK